MFSLSLPYSLSHKTHPSNMETTGSPVTPTLLQSESSLQVPESAIAFRDNLGGGRGLHLGPCIVGRWVVRGVFQYCTGERLQKSLMRGDWKGCEGHNINSKETSNTRCTGVGKNKYGDKKNNCEFYLNKLNGEQMNWRLTNWRKH